MNTATAAREPLHRTPAVQWGVIVTVIIQVLSIVWIASAANQRLERLEQDVAAISDVPGRVIRLETQFTDIKATLARLEGMLGTLVQRRQAASSSRLP